MANILANLFDARKQRNSKKLNYIHIGKCGGATVWRAIKESEKVNQIYENVYRTHVRKPIYDSNTHYIFVLRNPIDRALSAFNWRYKILISDNKQVGKFKGEKEVVEKYGSLENLAIQLYDEGRLNHGVLEEYKTIHHLKEDINFYLEGCFGAIKPSQIYALLCQETLDEDMQKFLEFNPGRRVNENKMAFRSDMKTLSSQAKNNLRKVLHKDFESIEKLAQLANLENRKLEMLLKK